MKAVVVVKIKGGYIAFPYEKEVTISDVGLARPVTPGSYDSDVDRKIGEAVTDIFSQLSQKNDPFLEEKAK